MYQDNLLYDLFLTLRMEAKLMFSGIGKGTAIRFQIWSVTDGGGEMSMGRCGRGGHVMFLAGGGLSIRVDFGG